MVEPNKYRRDVCMAMGFKVVDPFNENVEDFVLSEFGSLADYAIDAAGSQLPTAIKICDFRGTILIFGVNNSITPTICLGEIQQKEITVIGSFIALNSMPFAIKILESNILDIDPLITHILPIEKLQRGIELMTSGEGMKIIIAI